VFALALAIFLGLRGFTSNIGGKLSSLKNDIVMQLSSMNEKMTKVETTVGNLWNLAIGHLRGAPATVTVHLKNFGDTKISALPGPNETTYVIEVAQGMLDADLIAKASKITGFSAKEMTMLGREPAVFSLGRNRVRMILPCTESKKCTEYINEFLKWLDVEYSEVAKTFDEFETGIKTPHP
jgi:hypothetical protein